MATVTLSVPDEVLRDAREKLGRQRGSVEEYLLSAIESLALEETRVDPETERKLLDSLDSPLKTANEVDWAAKLKRFE